MKSAILIFGTFNPITNAHIHIGKIASQLVDVDDVLYIPAKDTFLTSWKKMKKGIILPASIRSELTEEAIKPYDFKVIRVEIENLVNGRTYNTVQYLKEQLHYDEIYICFGIDKISELDRWYKGEQLISENKFIIIDRSNKSLNDVKSESKLVEKYIDNFIQLHNDKYQDVSSTDVRKLHQLQKYNEFKDYVPNNVYKYLIENEEVFTDV